MYRFVEEKVADNIYLVRGGKNYVNNGPYEISFVIIKDENIATIKLYNGHYSKQIREKIRDLLWHHKVDAVKFHRTNKSNKQSNNPNKNQLREKTFRPCHYCEKNIAHRRFNAKYCDSKCKARHQHLRNYGRD